ncbi:MAG: glutamate synthase [Leptothrix sp. (in: Bacteria)]|nr:glutamate synthase [Leptothrix sp. (in: b-proteobacteria)]
MSADAEVHIAGAIAHTRQPHTLAACACISAMPEAEVIQASPEGRVVIVVEAPSARRVVDVLELMRGIEGVLNVALVYQHAESAAAMHEEMGP